MTLEPAEAERFFRIWWALLIFVNGEKSIVADLARRPSNGALRTEHAALLRDALWKDDSLRDQFIRDNPCDFNTADLALIGSWSDRVQDRFFVFRYLKRHTVFIGNDSRVFGVLGLYSPVESILGPRPPHLTDAVLLPFDGRIVIDGLLTRYGISFGAGIRQMLEGTYRSARKAGRVITSLPA